jgi:hypothetical protein
VVAMKRLRKGRKWLMVGDGNSGGGTISDIAYGALLCPHTDILLWEKLFTIAFLI